LAESALHEVHLLEKFDFFNIVVSVKSSDVLETIKANEYVARKVDYPIHVGITEAGTYDTSIIKSSVGIGYLLLQRIGDTVRVSIAGDPIREVYVARRLLVSLHLRKGGQVIACPTCARTEFDVETIASQVESLADETGLTIAVMGCVVNGIGEGKHADIGVAGTKDGAVIFKDGSIIKVVKKEKIYDELTAMIKKTTNVNVE